eukprot:Nitzschia sp. Nitz4//scaffold93_size78505//21682//26953//NITZ4_005417-RA/size78505-augustus-gene-0.48-mRNA-1//-1//CDS//3329560279//3469//frame0
METSESSLLDHETWAFTGSYDEHRRFLADYGEAEPLDYTVLSVAVMTLGLILCVEVARHNLDHMAEHRPFFKTVLEATYSELATLGFVEFCLFLLLRYYEIKNKERKEVFAEVHFALFYTAIFNAIQSVISAYFARRASNRLWVETEQLELDHYVEIREEFERTSEKYHAVLNHAEQMNQGPLLRQWRHFWHTVYHPSLRTRYLDLLVQVRFHQLRLHFLEGNQLPLTLKVSDYLKRAEQKVLIDMVHVSGVAWLLLTGGFNLMYFLEGMIANATSSEDAVASTMSYIFFGVLVLFILICLALYAKMRSIFQSILQMDHDKGNEDNKQETEKAGEKQQRSFFWFNEPKVVLSLIQFMQFGYASALSIVIMFWEDLSHDVPATTFLAATIACYAVFVYVLSKVLPQYTLCTSLGYLVNKQHLQAAVAMHKLEEAKRRQKRKMVQLTFDSESIICLDDDAHNKSSAALGSSGVMGSQSSNDVLNSSGRSNGSNLLSSLKENGHGITDSFRQKSDKSALLAELVKMDTASLRKQLPERSQTRLQSREERMKARRNRRKSVSDGVQLMRGLNNTFPTFFGREDASADATSANSPSVKSNPSNAPLPPVMEKAPETKQDRAARMANRRALRKKAVSASDVIQSWRGTSQEEIKQGPLFQMAAKRAKDDSFIEAKTAPKDDSSQQRGDHVSCGSDVADEMAKLHRKLKAERKALERSKRRKAASASSIIQGWREQHSEEIDSAPLEVKVPIANDSSNDMFAFGNASGSVSGDGFFLDENNTSDLESAVFQESSSSLMKGMDLDDEPIEHTADPSAVFANLDEILAAKASGVEEKPDDDGSLILAKMEDDPTVDTGKSVGELSDVEMVKPDFENLRSAYQWEEPWYAKLQNRFSLLSIKKSWQSYYVSERYVVLSHVFGTIAVFFLIGMRVEAMNAITGHFDPSDNTWELSLSNSFWAEVAWYSMFILNNLLLFWAVSGEYQSMEDRKATLAALIDMVLTLTCLTCLLIAESKRCCDDPEDYENGYYGNSSSHDDYYYSDHDDYYNSTDDGHRMLAEATGSSSSAYDDDIWHQCCPSWGFRTYGGLGPIEPYTSLIALRVLRFFIAGLCVRPSITSVLQKDTELEHHDEGHGHDHDGHGHGHGHASVQRGTALELWQEAVSKYPHIVEKHGQFSAELFQAMLGLEVVEPTPTSKDKLLAVDNQKLLTGPSEIEPTDNVEARKPTNKAALGNYKLSGDQYAHLPAESQAIILAGKIGRPVREKSKSLMHSSSHGSLPILMEDHPGENHHAEPQLHEFEIDEALLADEEVADSEFIAPNARLVRSMRRCDRRLYPLLKEWATVDVAITDYEIVYFEVTSKEPAKFQSSRELHEEKDALVAAMQATRGGKSLRLMDVARGRKMVGHVALSDIVEVKVERDMPWHDVSQLIEMEGPFDASSQPCTEFWSKENHVENSEYSRNIRWAKVKEDRVKICFARGTLLLRFYTDLIDVENAPTEEGLNGELKKNVAFQWAQTVAHICGTDQLKQMLPHYGAGDETELQDYLEVIHHVKEETRGHRRARSSMLMDAGQITAWKDDSRGHRRTRSSMMFDPTQAGAKPEGNSLFRALSRPTLRHSQSMGESQSKLSVSQENSEILNNTMPTRPRVLSERARTEGQKDDLPRRRTLTDFAEQAIPENSEDKIGTDNGIWHA